MVCPARFRAVRALLWSGSTRKTPHCGVLLAQNDTLGRGSLAGGSDFAIALSVGYAATSPKGRGHGVLLSLNNSAKCNPTCGSSWTSTPTVFVVCLAITHRHGYSQGHSNG